MLAYFILAAGFGLLALGGEAALRGAIGLSTIAQLPSLFIGLFVVSLGVVLPQLSVALQAAELGVPDLAFASIVGENIFTILLVLGLAASVGSIPAPPKIVFRDGGTMLVASLALATIASTGSLTRWTGIVLLWTFLAYLALSFATDWRRPVLRSLAEGRALAHGRPPRVELCLILLVLGAGCLFLGGQFTVDGAVAFARMEHVSEVAVALTLVAAGTLLPVLFVAVSASTRGMANVVAGELVGASVLNILFVLGLTAVVRPLTIPHETAQADVYVAVASAGVVVAMMLPGWRITRLQGAFLIACYIGYLGFLAWRQGLSPL
jgi:cation:H+ antiporter